MKKLDKSSYNALPQIEFNEGQRKLLSSDEALFNRCPSLTLSYEEAKSRLIEKGMSLENLNQLEGYLRGVARHIISNELRN